jgi:2-polyprenyl-3-methyl-5-hydroxy-6-metoxy-1,4-benzoquinol methylase
MLSNFPKKRPELSEEYQKIYNEHYKNNRDGATSASSVTRIMEFWLHKKVARDVKGLSDKSTLEIGAGTLNQLEFENTKPYDVVEPFVELYQNSKYLPQVRKIYKDIDEVESDNRYDRITSVATFEHITDLPKVVAKTCLFLEQAGSLRVSIPNEGTILWRMGWMFTSGLEFKLKYKLNYEVLLKNEHVNNADEIEMVLKYFYKDVKCSVMGIHKKLAFYRFYECKTPDLIKANEYLKK